MTKKKSPAKYTVLAVLHVIERYPNASTERVADLADVCEGTVLRAAQVLIRNGMIEQTPNPAGRGHAYRPTDKTQTVSLRDAIDRLGTRVGELLGENAQLKDWKQAAIDKYPDLDAPDPVTLRVRELLIEDWPAEAEQIEAGLWDEKNAAKALRRQIELEAV
jgi:DNA-binding MarR family transcriptional regulator